MNARFRELVETLGAKHRELLELPIVTASDIPSSTPTGGVYLFSEGEKHLYAGRTKRRIHVRVRTQFGANPSATSLPWLIARKETGKTAAYKREGSREDLLRDPDFRKAYEDARERVRNMHVRYVHEPDPLRQALLEIYVAVATTAEFNDFDTH